MSPSLLVVFYRDTCGYCHRLINDPIENTLQQTASQGIFINADTELKGSPFEHLFDSKRGVPQSVLCDLIPVGQVVGYLPQPEHAKELLNQRRT